jgi:hypothetical protein
MRKTDGNSLQMFRSHMCVLSCMHIDSERVHIIEFRFGNIGQFVKHKSRETCNLIEGNDSLDVPTQ